MTAGAVSYLQPRGDDCWLLSVHVQPNARRSSFVGQHGDALKLRLAAPPVDGKANAELCVFVAEALDLPRSAVSVVTGHASRSKRLLLQGVAPATLERLKALAFSPPRPST